MDPTTYAAPRSAFAIHSGSTIRGVGTAGSNPLAPTRTAVLIAPSGGAGHFTLGRRVYMMPSGLAAATPRNRDPEPPEQDVPCVRLKSNQPSFHATQLGSLADYAERSASPLMPGFKLQRIRCPPRRVGECDRDTLAERVVVGELERRQDGVQDADCGHRWTVVRPPRPLAWRADTTWSSCCGFRLRLTTHRRDPDGKFHHEPNGEKERNQRQIARCERGEGHVCGNEG